MAEITFVCLYLDYAKTLAPFSDAERGRLMTAMLNYAASGKEPEFFGSERYIWPFLQGQIDRDKKNYAERCARNRINGAKGGRPRKTDPEETEWFSEEPKKPNNNTNKNKNKNENNNENENINNAGFFFRGSPPV